MKYSFNIKNAEGVALAQRYDVNASYKDLAAVCDAVRYMNASAALSLLDKVISMEMPIPYRRHNKHMGARHELGGRKGAYPVKAAKEVKLAIINAIANANNMGLPGEDLYIVHASANKTRIERRYPSRGTLAWGRGMYGRASIMHSDLEYAKIEIGLANKDENWLTKNMKYFIKKKEQESAKFYKNEKRKGAKEETEKKASEKPKSAGGVKGNATKEKKEQESAKEEANEVNK
ncbi:MAG: 50S ribosomal protein L22 [Candidatus Micrarchaeia archaeon]|jgi:ribosomal protein uL22